MRNAPCPCGSGKKYKQCCLREGIEYGETETGQIVRRVQLNDEVVEALDELRRLAERHGDEPEYIFQDAPHPEVIEHQVVQAMQRAGVKPALIYAYEQTRGRMLNADNIQKVPDKDIAEWEAVIDEYEQKTGKKASPRLLTDEDFQGIMGNGPGT